MLNIKQWAALRVGIAVVVVMVLFPPFFNTGGLVGGVQLAFLLHPPAPKYDIDFRPALVGNVRKGQAYRLTWSGSTTPLIESL